MAEENSFGNRALKVTRMLSNLSRGTQWQQQEHAGNVELHEKETMNWMSYCVNSSREIRGNV